MLRKNRKSRKSKTLYRSKFEGKVGSLLGTRDWIHEDMKLPYVLNNNYIPDFRWKGTMVFIEAKGRLTGTDRRKMIAVKEQNPGADIRLVFQRNNKLYKGSKTTYLQWAEKHGFRATVYPELPLP